MTASSCIHVTIRIETDDINRTTSKILKQLHNSFVFTRVTNVLVLVQLHHQHPKVKIHYPIGSFLGTSTVDRFVMDETNVGELFHQPFVNKCFFQLQPVHNLEFGMNSTVTIEAVWPIRFALT